MQRIKVSLLAVLVSLFAVHSARAAVLLDKVVAVVNQDVITWSELYRSMEMEAPPQAKELSEEARKKMFSSNEGAFLETLINLRLELQEARRLGMTASDEEVLEAVASIKNKYSMSDADFAESLKKEGFSLHEYKERLREQIVVSKVINNQIRSKILVSEKDIQKFIEDGKGSAENSEGYKLSQIFFKKSGGEDRSLAEKKAEEVLRKLKEGETFKALAISYSEDPSAAAGGDMGLIRKGNLLPAFAEVVSQLKAGEVSKPFWTQEGLHIVKLDEKVEARGQTEIREEARQQIFDKMFTKKYNAWLKELRGRGFIEVRL